MSLVADAGWAMLVAINNEAFGVVSLPVIILAEAVVVWEVLPRQGVWRSLGLALGYSVVMNLVSAAVGLVSGSWWVGGVEPTARNYPSALYYSPPPGGRELLWLKLTAVFWAVSVVSEGLVLMVASRARRKGGTTWPRWQRTVSATPPCSWCIRLCWEADCRRTCKRWPAHRPQILRAELLLPCIIPNDIPHLRDDKSPTSGLCYG